MTIESRANKIIIFLRTAMFAGAMTIVFSQTMDVFWSVCAFFLGYVTYISFVEFFIACFMAPEWIEIQQVNIFVKMPFLSIFSEKVSNVQEIRKENFLNLRAAYDITMIFTNGRKLFLGKPKFVGLMEFIKEIEKANPNCKVDEWLR